MKLQLKIKTYKYLEPDVTVPIQYLFSTIASLCMQLLHLKYNLQIKAL